jgi:hypothetical protein
MNTDNVYLKTLLMPVMGLALLMFLPAAGFALTGYALWKRLRRGPSAASPEAR